MKINGPIGIKCADIYLRFPEIMEEEFDELIEFLNDNNIRYEGATKKFQQLNNLVNSCQQEIRNLKSTLEEIREYIEQNKVEKEYTDRGGFRVHTGTYFVESADDLLQIIDKGSDVK